MVRSGLKHRIPVHVVGGADFIAVAVHMEYHAPLTVIPEGLAVALLVGDLADLSLTVVAVGAHAAVGIPGTGDIARKVIGIAFLPAVCLADVLDASPCVQVIARLIAVAVYNTRDPSTAVIAVFLGGTPRLPASCGACLLLPAMRAVCIPDLLPVCLSGERRPSIGKIPVLLLHCAGTVCSGQKSAVHIITVPVLVFRVS